MLATRLKKSLYIAILLSSLCMLQTLADDEKELPDDLKEELKKPAKPAKPAKPVVSSRHLGGRDCHDDDNYAKFCNGWKRYCDSNKNVQQFCKETCGLCGEDEDECVDYYGWCGRYERYCWHKGVIARCPLTCGNCDDDSDEKEEDPCSSEPCQNGGDCYVKGNSFRCGCTSGYSGSTCSKKKVCKDKNRRCSRKRWQCRWSQSVRNDCKKTCGQCKDDDDSDSNPCESSPCSHGGTCTRNGNRFSCKCTSDRTGSTCDQRRSTNVCSRNNPCENGGTCNPTSTSYTCDCETGYTGRNCQTFDPCATDPCQNRGTCEKSGSSYTCDCRAGYTGRNCQTANPCASDPCRHGGTCDRSGSSYTCDCRAGYTGRNCQTADPCAPNPCQNRGTCKKSGSSFTCNCRSGYTGRTCRTTDPCANDPCQNGGTCEKYGSSYTCDCKSGYTGRTCQTAVNPCNSRPCQNGGTCQRRGTSYTCNCRSGYNGQNCENAVGKCKDLAEWCHGYRDRCDMPAVIHACKKTCNLCPGGGGSDPCDDKPCQNGGTCTKDGTGYTCDCERGWTGSTCEDEINACDSYPCKNEGTCMPSPSGSEFMCSCTASWDGPTCENEINPCGTNPCKNGGDCTPSGNEYTCDCTASWTGPTCEDAVGGGGGSCFPNPCKNKGTCYKKGDAVKCRCAIGYRGSRCNTKLQKGQLSDCTQDCEGGTRYTVSHCASSDVTQCPRVYQDCNTKICARKTCTRYRFGTFSKCCTLSPGTCGVGGRTLKRIIGGKKSEAGQWPWMAALHTLAEAYFCGGVIISDRWIVTAAHCINYYSPSQVKVLVGAVTRSNPESGHAWYVGEKKVVHPDYNDPIDDLALLKVSKTIVTTKYVMPLCLPGGERLEEDTVCFAAGWGIARQEDIEKKIPSDFLKHVALRTMPLDTCVQAYKGTDYEEGVTPKIICSGRLSGGSDTCNGDSGGPLFCQRKGGSCEWYLAGTTSFGATECGVGTLPGAYCDIAQYEAWINSHISG